MAQQLFGTSAAGRVELGCIEIRKRNPIHVAACCELPMQRLSPSPTYQTGPEKLMAFGDEIKAAAVAAVAAPYDRGVRTVMPTGDNAGSARSAAGRLGIDDIVPDVLPEGKSDPVAALRGEGRTVAMIGDGFKDALPLRRRASASQCRRESSSLCT